MKRQTIITVTLLICILLPTSTQAKSEDYTNAPTISVTKFDISDKNLKLRYKIRNTSENDIWILAGGGKYRKKFNTGMAAGMSISKDGSTLSISARLNVSETTPISIPSGDVPIYVRLVRLYPGESQTESFLTRLPVYLSPYTEHAKRGEQGIQCATRLSIKLGYYFGNLPERIFKKLKPPENELPKGPDIPTTPDTFSMWNELTTSRDEELLVPVFFHEIKGENEHTLKTVVKNLSIPYMEKIYHPSTLEPPDVTSCVKVELRYKPSMLEYFIPYASQQSLLNPDEIRYLQSDKTFFTKDKQMIKIIANNLLRAKTANTIVGGIGVRYRSLADVVCHYDSKSSLTFPIYDDHTILIEGEEFSTSEGFPILKFLTPRIQSIDLRMRCAKNLKNLWYRFRFYN